VKIPLRQRLLDFVGHWQKLGVFAIAGTIIGFWVSYGDKAAERHERSWKVLREAIAWSNPQKGGNIGQVNAIETLTRDCDSWLRHIFLVNYFFQDCVPLISVSLTSMDLRKLRAAGADFSDSTFACSNFGGAKLTNANLTNARFKAASLRAADFSGADLTNACLYDANIAGAYFASSTKVDIAALKKACILKDPGQSARDEIRTNSSEIAKIVSEIRDCKSAFRCEGYSLDWDCPDPPL
jgi:Pentapeptide repeats (9 copies)